MLHTLVRLDLASALLLALLLLAILGSYVPQRPSSLADDPERQAQWHRDVRATYGRLTDVLYAVGAFRWFSSPVFWLPAGLLLLATLACTIHRWRGVRRQAFHRPVRCSAPVLETRARTTTLSVSSAAEPASVVRDALERWGYQVRSRAEGDVVALRGDRYRLAPLATLVTHGAVLLLALGVLVSHVWGWRETLTVSRGETVKIGHVANEGAPLQLRSDGFVVTRYPDGKVAGYNAEIAIIGDGAEIARGHVRLNEPFVYRGVGFYLRSYTPPGSVAEAEQQSEGEEYVVTLQAVRDPGYGLVVGAGLLLCLGLTVSFNFPHCCIRARIESPGVVHLVGRADRRAWGFDGAFDDLVTEIGRGMDG